MDAVKFIEERRRMYKVTGKHSPTLAEWVPAEDVVKEVEEWVASHPRKTRQSVFLEQRPEAKVDARGILDIEPCLLLKRYSYKAEDGCDDVDGNCIVCRREFWGQEAE